MDALAHPHVDSFFSGLQHRPWSRQLNYELDHELRDMDRHFDELQRGIVAPYGIGGHHGTPQVPALIEPHVIDKDGQKQYHLRVGMGQDFAPEDLKMRVRDNVMTIQAVKDQVSDDGNYRVHHEVRRKFLLPSGVNPKKIKSVLDHNGVLKIEAPLPQRLEAPKPRPIAIDFEQDEY